jgi:hypothetical protein
MYGRLRFCGVRVGPRNGRSPAITPLGTSQRGRVFSLWCALIVPCRGTPNYATPPPPKAGRRMCAAAAAALAHPSPGRTGDHSRHDPQAGPPERTATAAELAGDTTRMERARTGQQPPPRTRHALAGQGAGSGIRPVLAAAGHPVHGGRASRARRPGRWCTAGSTGRRNDRLAMRLVIERSQIPARHRGHRKRKAIKWPPAGHRTVTNTRPA